MSLTLNEYQRRARATAIYPDLGKNLSYPTLGLCGEAGEVAEKVKKILRDQGGEILPHNRDAIKKELGDVLWYIASLCSELGISMENVAQSNLEKLLNRKENGTLGGSGDDR